jgi:hypothetical protein
VENPFPLAGMKALDVKVPLTRLRRDYELRGEFRCWHFQSSRDVRLEPGMRIEADVPDHAEWVHARDQAVPFTNESLSMI